MANFPSSLPSITNPSSTDNLSSPAHATIHGNANDEVTAVATKIGTGASTPTDNTYLAGNGTGTSTWKTVTPVEAWVTDSDGATITFDLSAGKKHKVTLGGNRTLALSNVNAGHAFIIELIQDGTGSRTVTWFTTIKWAGGSAPTLTTTASKADCFGFIQTSTDNYIGFVVGQNI